MNKLPLVSIGLPVFNGDNHIKNTLDSLLLQTYSNIEIIISDNGSTDQTHKICSQYTNKDKRIKYYRNETNMGSIWNFNKVFELSEGDFFMWAAHHDLWHPNFITKCLEVLTLEPFAVLCYPRIQFIDDAGNLLQEVGENFDTIGLDVVGRLHVYLMRTRINAIIYGLFRNDALKSIMPAPTIWASDWWIMTQLALKGYFVQVPEVLFYFRDDFLKKSAKQRWESLHPGNKNKKMRFFHMAWAWGIFRAVLDSKTKIGAKPFLILDALYCLTKKFRKPIWAEIKSTFGFTLHTLKG